MVFQILRRPEINTIPLTLVVFKKIQIQVQIKTQRRVLRLTDGKTLLTHKQDLAV